MLFLSVLWTSFVCTARVQETFFQVLIVMLEISKVRKTEAIFSFFFFKIVYYCIDFRGYQFLYTNLTNATLDVLGDIGTIVVYIFLVAFWSQLIFFGKSSRLFFLFCNFSGDGFWTTKKVHIFCYCTVLFLYLIFFCTNFLVVEYPDAVFAEYGECFI